MLCKVDSLTILMIVFSVGTVLTGTLQMFLA